MPDLRCHLCDHPNALGARLCAACGIGLTLRCAACGMVRSGSLTTCTACGAAESDAADFEMQGVVRPASQRVGPTYPAFEPSEWGGLPVLSLDDAVPAEALRPTAPAAWASASALATAFGPSDPGDPGMHLRDMNDPRVWLLPDGQPAPPPPVARVAGEPVLVRSDSYVTPPAVLPDPPVDIDLPLDPGAASAVVAMPLAPPAEPPAPFVDHRDAKAARRAAVRRARLAAQAEGRTPEPMPTDVLVVDGDDASRQRLCLLLDGFGFNVQSSRSPAHAVSLLASRVYLAVFADVDLQDARPEGGVEVCRLAREGGPLPDGRRPSLIMMSAHPTSAERVRAALAGSEQFLVKPLGRGHVARALEACDIALPSDPRRS